MKRRTTRPAAAALTALALLAGTAMTGGPAEAQTPTFNPLQGFTKEALNNALKERCEAAWPNSQASTECQFNYTGLGFTAEYPHCILVAHCRTHQNTTNYHMFYTGARWWGLLSEVDDLRNCQGRLTTGSC